MIKGKETYTVDTGSVLKLQDQHLVVKQKEQKASLIPLDPLKRLYLKGGALISVYLLLELLHRQVDVVFLSYNGQYVSRIPGLPGRHIELRQKQFRLYEDEAQRSHMAARFVRGKIWNAYILLKRYLDRHQSSDALNTLLRLYNQVKANRYDLDTLTGKEGAASQCYFTAFGKVIESYGSGFAFDKRTRRPPTDPVNAMLSFGYTLLFNEVMLFLDQTGLDPYLGFLHASRYGRLSLALDLMEEFRPVIVDRLVLNLVGKKILKPEDFHTVEANGARGVYLSKDKIKLFTFHFNDRLETVRFWERTGRDMSYRRIIDHQVHQLTDALHPPHDYRPFRLLK